MLMLSFFTSVEFYVVMAVVAGAIVALASRPQSRGPVMEYLLASVLSADDDSDGAPSVEFICLDDGTVRLLRHGVEGVTLTGAVSLAVTCDGVNVSFEERLVQGSDWDEPARTASFRIDFLRPGRYHIRYNSDRTGLFAAFQLHVRPGIKSMRILSR